MTEAEQERAKVVAWLLGQAREWRDALCVVSAEACEDAADSIERGDHLTDTPA